MLRELLTLFVLAYVLSPSVAYPQVKGKDFYYNGEKVFFSGANIAWVSEKIGNDFGNGMYWQRRSKMQEWFAGIHAHGGNAARVWLHVWGDQSPHYDNQGYTVGTDKQNSLVKELQALLDDAEKNNVFVLLCIFSTKMLTTNTGLVNDDGKIKSYIDKALKPMVEGLKGKKAMLGWELFNEPEGGMDINYWDSDKDPCFDPSRWHKSNSGMGFEKKNGNVIFPIKKMLKLFNWLTSAIHETDPTALVTTGSWNPRTSTDKCSNCYNLYSHDCMVKAGGKKDGVFDFYQMHTYECSQEFPIARTADEYGLDKPLIVGEFSVKRSCVSDPSVPFKHFYNSGYAGALDWQYNDHNDNDMDHRDTINKGLMSIKGQTSHGKIDVKIG